MDPTVIGVIAVALIVLAAIVARKTGIASVLILLLLGVGIGYLPGIPLIEVNPELILAVLLPLLLYSSAVNVPVTDLRRNLGAISGLSVTLVVVTSVIVGWVLYLIIPEIGLAGAIALGAIVSPTDAVAATSIAKKLGLPPRLVSVLEGESLVNDASSLVLLRSALAATAGTVSLWGVIGDFAYAVALAVVIGAFVGWVTVAIRARLSETVLTTTISFIVPFLAFLPAEHLGASGVLAVVVAGLVTGHRGARKLAASQRISEHTNWNTIQFILEHGVFLVMGLELHALVDDVQPDPLSLLPIILIGLGLTVLVMGLRFGFVFPLMAWQRYRERKSIELGDDRISVIQERLDSLTPSNEVQARRKNSWQRRLTQQAADSEFYAKEGLNWKGSAIISWAGMRGVVTLAAAQSLPETMPMRSTLILIAFTVAITTLVVCGLSLPTFIRATGVVGGDEDIRRREAQNLMSAINAAAYAALDDPEVVTIDGTPASDSVVNALRTRYQPRERPADLSPDAGEQMDVRGQFVVLNERLRSASRDALLDARALGTYSSEAVTMVQRLLDIEESKFDGF